MPESGRRKAQGFSFRALHAQARLTPLRRLTALNARQLALAGVLAGVLLLAAQNVVIFYNHYFNDYGFPWDFISGYYAITVYWIGLAAHGYVPTWIPFQQMGYPMDLLLQSGIHYPPFWVFPLLGIPYTLHAATVFQCLHILFGALGMFAFLRLALGSTRYALLGAFAFQFFGGFYSNAEHADIVRAFAFAPWLFYCFYLNRDHLKISRRYFLIPLFILFSATGGYPGNFISSAVVMGIFVAAQVIALWFTSADRRQVARAAVFILGMGVLGVGISFFHLGPGWLYRGYMIRTEGNTLFNSLGVEYFAGLFLNNNIYKSEVSMTSTFITLPMFVMLAYLPARVLKRWWIMAVVGLFAVLMVMGTNSLVWYVLTKLFSPLRLSRFPSSDYRVLVAIPLIFFATLGVKSWIERELGWQQFVVRTGLVALLVAQVIFISYVPQRAETGWLQIRPFVRAFEVLAVTVLGVVGYYFVFKSRFFRQWAAVGGYAALGLLAALLAVDGVRVLPNMITWQAQDISSVYSSAKWALAENGQILSYQILAHTPAQRPERIVKPSIFDYSWEGYITGKYLLADKVPYVLKAPYLTGTDPVYLDYMLKGWTPLLLNAAPAAGQEVTLPVEAFASAMNDSSPHSAVRQTRYGINEISYEVSLDQPRLLVENEIYFPGWTAVLSSGGTTTQISALATNGTFRSWLLPAGTYHMQAHFTFPNTALFGIISAGAGVIWLLVIAFQLGWVSRGWKQPRLEQPGLETVEQKTDHIRETG